MPPVATKSKKAIFNPKVKVKVTRLLTLVSFEMASLVEYMYACQTIKSLSGVEINTGPVARGQWIFLWASEICYPLARLACKILKPNF